MDNTPDIKTALRKAYLLGQTYWQQADSEYTSQHRKADETQAKFEQLVTDTVAALTSPEKVPDAVMQALDRMSTPLHDSRLSGLTAELDAANIKTIRDYVLSGAVPAKVVGDDQHPDDAAVDRFSVAMKAKIAKKRAQGRGGWDDERICSPDDLARMLVDHVRKGDPVDVGNLAMMLFNRPDAGAALCRAALSADGGKDKRDAAWSKWTLDPKFYDWNTTEQCAALHFNAGFDAAIAANQAKGDA